MLKFFKSKNLPVEATMACNYTRDLRVEKFAFIGMAKDFLVCGLITKVRATITDDNEWVIVFNDGHVVDGFKSKEDCKDFIRTNCADKYNTD